MMEQRQPRDAEEEWLAQLLLLEMEKDKNPIQHDDGDDDPSERKEMIRGAAEEGLKEELAAVDYSVYDALLCVSVESNASCNHNSDYSFLTGHFQSLSPDDINAISSSHQQHNWGRQCEANNNVNPLLLMASTSTPPPLVPVNQHHHQLQSSSDSDSVVGVAPVDNKRMSKKDRHGGGSVSGSSSTKRKRREPNQIKDHILAERKRRELLSTQFISLSSILPGLKKTDKTSVLGEAIKYMKQLQEKVKALEEVAAKQTVESVVVVKKSQILLPDDHPNNYSSNSQTETETETETEVPEIKVKLLSSSILIKVYCQNYKGILPKIFQHIENLNLSVVNCSVIPFGSSALDITILAQAQLGKELNANVKEVITSLRWAVRRPLVP